MRAQTVLLTMSLAAIGFGQAPSVFTPQERDAVLKFWSRPDRYTVGLPGDVTEKGAWQVRLTVAGSTWLWNYQKGKKILPLAAPVPQTEEQKAWEAWVTARIARDRWEAWRTAQDENERQLGVRVPGVDKTIPETEPADPGPIPEGLKASVGEPPRFAEACVPMEHRIAFDDQAITYRDRHRPGSPRYAYFRFDQGVGDAGVQVKTMPADRLDRLFKMAGINEAEARVMRAVSLLEGGFDSVNTYDTGFVSIGFIQFACLREGGGSLGAMLRQYKQENPEQYRKDFRVYGIDVTEDAKLAALDLASGEERIGAAAAAEIIEDKRLIAVFQRAGRVSEPFVAAQIKAAKAMYLPASDPLSVTVDGRTISGKVSDVIRSEAGMAVLMDRKVNTGKVDPLQNVVSGLALALKVNSLADLAPYERIIIEACRYRKDYLTDLALSQPAATPARASTPTSRGSGGTRNRRGGRRGG
ncbi:MAG: hypothetical protein ACO1SV_20160 [Fimbriimonas sp.]